MLGDCPRLASSSAFSKLLASCGPTLLHFDIAGCKEISDVGGFCDLPRHCPNLVSLSLNGCEGVTDLFLLALGQGCPKLESLSLQRCKRISDVGLCRLAPQLPNLKHFDCSGCTQLSDRTIVQIGRHCPHLESLRLFCCSAITDTGLLATLAVRQDALHRLAVLDLSWCFRVTPHSVAEIVKRCPPLHMLVIEGMEHFTAVDLSRLHTFRATLRIETEHTNREVDDGTWESPRAVRRKSPTALHAAASGQQLAKAALPARPSRPSRRPQQGSTRRMSLHELCANTGLARRHTIAGADEAGLVPTEPCASPAPALRKRSESVRIRLAKQLSLGDLENLENASATSGPTNQEVGRMHNDSMSSQSSWKGGGNPWTGSQSARARGRSVGFFSENMADDHVSSRRFGDDSHDLARLNAFAAVRLTPH